MRVPLLPLGLLASACTADTAWLAHDADIAPAADATRARRARVLRPLVPGAGSPDAAPPAQLRLPLFDDVVIDTTLDRLVQRDGRTSWVGHVDGHPHHEVVLTRAGQATHGLVRTPLEVYRLEPAGADVLRIEALAGRSLPGEAPLVADMGADRPTVAADASDAPVVDVLVAVSEDVFLHYGDADAVDAAAAGLITQANAGFEASSLSPRLRLAGVERTGWTEDGRSFGEVLGAIRDTNDDVLDGLPDARRTAGADLVAVLLEGDGSSCGLAYLMTSPSASFKRFAYSVTARSCAAGNLSFAHEIGHNLGSQHNRADAGTEPAYPYGYGHRDAEAGQRTVMAYTCDDTYCPRINRWSDPGARVDGAALGVAIGEADAAHNVASLALTAPVAAAFEDPPPEPTPEGAVLATPAPGRTLPGDTVTFTWDDAGADDYTLELGSTPGGDDLADVDAAGTSVTIDGLPTDGRGVYATLWSRFGDDWQTTEASYTAADTVAAAELTAPTAGSVLSGRTTFTWTDVGVDRYALVAGDSPFGADLGTWSTSETSLTLSSLPDDGRTIWITLYTWLDGRWTGSAVTFQAGATPVVEGPATFLAPEQDSVVSGSDVTFRWTDSEAPRYVLILSQDEVELHRETVEDTRTTVELGPEVTPGPVTATLATELDGRWFARELSFILD